MKIILFNVKFSPNLGDGILSECLEAELRGDGVEVESLDLAGRKSFGGGNGLRSLQLRVLEAMPAVLRRMLVSAMLRRLVRGKLMPQWKDALREADAVIVGGGNLFSDVDLNFPMKVNGALNEANSLGLPIAVYGVGVTLNWSDAGKRLFTDSLATARLVDVSARDERSCNAWKSLMQGTGVQDARLSYDSGLLAIDHYVSAPKHGGLPLIGIGITDPVALSYHGGPRQSRQDFSNKLIALIDELRARSPVRISLFSNGSPEDQQFLAGFSKQVSLEGVEIVPPFALPSDLAFFLSGCDLVMAHRLHACIVAHSFGIPTIGFTWDIKVQSFFERIKRQGYLIAFEEADSADLSQLAAKAIAEGLDLVAHRELLSDCRRDVATLSAKLYSVIKRRGNSDGASAMVERSL